MNSNNYDPLYLKACPKGRLTGEVPSPSYDPITEIGLGYSNLTQYTNTKEGNIVLNFGCGWGDESFVIRRMVGQNGRVLGVDYSIDNIAIARQNCGNFGYNNVTFFVYQNIIQKNAPQMIFEENSFDIVVCNYLLNLFPNKEDIFKDFYRLLKPHGQLVITDFFSNTPLPTHLINTIKHKYFQQIHIKNEDISDISAKFSSISNQFLTQNDYICQLDKIGFKKIDIKTQTVIDKENGELLLYMEQEDIVKTNSEFYKIVLHLEK